MINVCKCEYGECPNAKNCKRFLEAVGEIMNFKAICNESNNYERIIRKIEIDTSKIESEAK